MTTAVGVPGSDAVMNCGTYDMLTPSPPAAKEEEADAFVGSGKNDVPIPTPDGPSMIVFPLTCVMVDESWPTE